MTANNQAEIESIQSATSKNDGVKQGVRISEAHSLQIEIQALIELLTADIKPKYDHHTACVVLYTVQRLSKMTQDILDELDS